MEDITKDFKLPCVMDVKIGVQTWEPDAPEEKVLVERVSIRFFASVLETYCCRLRFLSGFLIDLSGRGCNGLIRYVIL